MRIVLDTNLLIAGNYNKQSNSFKILKKAERGELTVLWTKDLKKEAESILNNIKAKKEFRAFLENSVFKKENEIKDPPEIKVIAEDPSDNKFLACAQKGGAKMLVTNDRHVLALKKYQETDILTPTKAIKMLKT